MCSGVSSFTQRLVEVEKEEEQEEAPSSVRPLPQPCLIPRRLAIGPGGGGTPVTPELVEVRQNDCLTVYMPTCLSVHPVCKSVRLSRA